MRLSYRYPARNKYCVAAVRAAMDRFPADWLRAFEVSYWEDGRLSARRCIGSMGAMGGARVLQVRLVLRWMDGDAEVYC